MLSLNRSMTSGITLPTASVVIAKVKNIRQASQRISCWLRSSSTVVVVMANGFPPFRTLLHLRRQTCTEAGMVLQLAADFAARSGSKKGDDYELGSASVGSGGGARRVARSRGSGG
jgi:hypothetical protein